jgi:two-component system phosphate regulon sensor histidine kinase PhoR
LRSGERVNPSSPRRRPTRPGEPPLTIGEGHTYDLSRAQVRLAVVMVLCFAVLPAVLILTVGVLVLVFEKGMHDIIFGILILSFSGTLTAGITYTFLYIRRATSLARLQTEFVQRVSHELRTPLTSIRLFVETLQAGQLQETSGRLSNEEVRESLDVLANETGRLTVLVERLLKWAGMEAGRRIYTPEPVAPRLIAEQAMAAIDSQVRLARHQGSVDVTCEVADGLPSLEVDPAAMSEALLNVLNNALRYTGADKVIRLRVGQRERSVEFLVSDNGPGIPSDHHRRIFQKFYRVVDPAAPDVGGTGLGLAMVHHIVRAHGGSITVESEPGRGATFRILLPVSAEELGPKRASLEPAPLAPAQTTPKEP